MRKNVLRRRAGQECELCHNEFPVLMMVGGHILCAHCFTAGTSREEEECGKFKEEYSSLINE